MTTTSIEWTQNPDGSPGRSWNPLRGCSRKSPGCQQCYAEDIAYRFSGLDANGRPRAFHGLINEHGAWNGKIIQAPERTLLEPMFWRKPTRVFVNSMTDLFHENAPDEWIDSIFAVMARARQHTYIVLTKRADRMREYMTHPDRQFGILKAAARLPYCAMEQLSAWPLPNVWLGVSVEDQKRADGRIPDLLKTPAAIRFLSCEPLLGPIDLREVYVSQRISLDALTGIYAAESSVGSFAEQCDRARTGELDFPPMPPKLSRGVDWVIVGGESGREARPIHPDWAHSLRDQCQPARVPFFFKQWGEWWPICETPRGWYDIEENQVPLKRQIVVHEDGEVESIRDAYFRKGAMTCLKVGKKTSGRLLAGRMWEEFPA